MVSHAKSKTIAIKNHTLTKCSNPSMRRHLSRGCSFKEQPNYDWLFYRGEGRTKGVFECINGYTWRTCTHTHPDDIQGGDGARRIFERAVISVAHTFLTGGTEIMNSAYSWWVRGRPFVYWEMYWKGTGDLRLTQIYCKMMMFRFKIIWKVFISSSFSLTFCEHNYVLVCCVCICLSHFLFTAVRFNIFAHSRFYTFI